MRQTNTIQPTSSLRAALMANAAFSTLTGGVLAAVPGMVGDWLGVSIDGWLRMLGIALLGHAVLLFWVSRQGSIQRWGWLNLLAIAPYPLAMIVLVATGTIPRDIGKALALADGAVVGLIAGAHWLGLRATSPEPQATHVVA